MESDVVTVIDGQFVLVNYSLRRIHKCNRLHADVLAVTVGSCSARPGPAAYRSHSAVCFGSGLVIVCE